MANAGISLRTNLSSFIADPNLVTALVQEYHKLVKANPSWRINRYIAVIKREIGWKEE